MTIPRKKAHRNDEMRGMLDKSIGVVWLGKLWGRTFGVQSLRWSDQMAQSICRSGPEVLLSRLPKIKDRIIPFFGRCGCFVERCANGSCGLEQRR